MEPFKVKERKTPEAKIQDDIIRELRYREWLVKPTHGSMFQAGFPDLYCAHKSFGARWVEVKNASNYRFTDDQLIWFPQFAAAHVGIWILTSATPTELQKLMGPPNWHTYIKW